MGDKGRERLLYTAFKESRAAPQTLLGSIYLRPSPTPKFWQKYKQHLKDGRDPDTSDRKLGVVLRPS